MFKYYRRMKEKYEIFQQPGEGFGWWYIRREAPDWVKQVLAFMLLGLWLYLYTDIILVLNIVKFCSIAGVIMYLVMGVQKVVKWWKRRNTEKLDS